MRRVRRRATAYKRRTCGRSAAFSTRCDRKRAFEGDTSPDTCQRAEVDPEANPPSDFPSSIAALHRAPRRIGVTARLSRRRAFSCRSASVATSSGAGAPVPAGARSKPRWRSVLPVAAAMLLTAILAGLGAWRLRPSSPVASVARFSFTLPEAQQLTNIARHAVAVSPDGTQLAYVANNRLFVRSISEFDAHAIPGTDGDGSIGSPAFSPDGRSIAFHSQRSNAIKRVAVSGGAPVPICLAAPPFGMTWDSSAE